MFIVYMICILNPLDHAVQCFRCHSLPKTLFFGAPKSLQMVIAAMKLKDAYSLEEKL